MLIVNDVLAFCLLLSDLLYQSAISIYLHISVVQQPMRHTDLVHITMLDSISKLTFGITNQDLSRPVPFQLCNVVNHAVIIIWIKCSILYKSSVKAS